MSAPQAESLLQRRWNKFKTLKRGYYSFRILVAAYFLSFFVCLAVNDKPVVVSGPNGFEFPALQDYPVIGSWITKHPARTYGLEGDAAPDWHEVREVFDREDSGWMIMPLYPHGPYDHYLELEGRPPHAPSREHWCGTDGHGRDIFARITWGFNVSITFAILVTSINYLIGISIGAVLGYYGGKVDILLQRLIEIWSAVPFLYFMMILSSVFRPTEPFDAFFTMVLILSAFGWMGLTYYIRGEFYREKSKDYVAAAIAQGEGDATIIFKHILPNSLTPVITFAPFAVVGTIGALVSLDFLGFGLPVPTPSWGELVSQGKEYLHQGKWWLIAFPLSMMFMTLMLVVFIGEAIREAFDPKVFSRLR